LSDDGSQLRISQDVIKEEQEMGSISVPLFDWHSPTPHVITNDK
jgi:hypothetical protein